MSEIIFSLMFIVIYHYIYEHFKSFEQNATGHITLQVSISEKSVCLSNFAEIVAKNLKIFHEVDGGLCDLISHVPLRFILTINKEVFGHFEEQSDIVHVSGCHLLELPHFKFSFQKVLLLEPMYMENICHREVEVSEAVFRLDVKAHDSCQPILNLLLVEKFDSLQNKFPVCNFHCLRERIEPV